MYYSFLFKRLPKFTKIFKDLHELCAIDALCTIDVGIARLL